MLKVPFLCFINRRALGNFCGLLYVCKETLLNSILTGLYICTYYVHIGVQHHLLEKRSTCSQHATDRGPEQKVISYSFYGPLTSAYFNGIFENLAGVRMYYPEYVMRLYLDRSKAMSDNIENYQKLCQLFCRETNFDLCDVNEIGNFMYIGMITVVES